MTTVTPCTAWCDTVHYDHDIHDRVVLSGATGDCFAGVALEATGDGPARIFLNVTNPSQTVSLERHISPTFGTVRMRTVTPDQLTRWYLSLNSDTPTERAHAYQLLNAIFATAADSRVRIVSTNPCQIAGAGKSPERMRSGRQP